ncbi:ribonuclease P protein component [Candidatus Falkowbacteria bacterium]|nr:ribonuclease P protein component [Candidatus Falkowbacteria bacterium]
MLPKKNRITKTLEFDALFGAKFKQAGGQSFSTDAFVFKILPNKTKVNRFGFIVGTKVDNRASVRNKVKRHLRAIFHKQLNNVDVGYDFLVVAAKPSAKLEFVEVEKQCLDFLTKMRVLKPNKI